MALQVTELRESRRTSIIENRKIGFTVWHVYDDGGAAIDSSDVAGLIGSSLPAAFASHPDDSTLRRVNVPSIERVPGHTDTMRAEFEYRQFDGVIFNSDDKMPGEPGYLEYSSQSTAIFDDFYRDPTTTTDPTDGDAAAGNTSDIGGTEIDEKGVPERRLRLQQEVTITELLEINPYDGPPISDWEDYIGKRNSKKFKGSPVGKVVYLGHTLQTTGLGRVRVAHNFLQDQLYHMVQVPGRNTNGDPALNVGNTHVEDVYWRQPYPDKADFNHISDNF